MHRTYLTILALSVCIAPLRAEPPGSLEAYLSQMNSGNGHLSAGRATAARTAYSAALAIQPTDVDARLNLAIASLRADDLDAAINAARAVLEFDKASAAAYYVIGCAHNRARRSPEAIRALQQSLAITPGIAPAHFQLGLAFRNQSRLDEAIRAWDDTVTLAPDHPSAHYRLSQALWQFGREADADHHLREHQRILAERGPLPPGPDVLEASIHLTPRAPDVSDQPSIDGEAVQFVDVTAALLPGAATLCGPLAVADLDRDSVLDLLVLDDQSRIQRLNWEADVCAVREVVGVPARGYNDLLAADLNNDRRVDLVLVSVAGMVVLLQADDGSFADATTDAGLDGVAASRAILVDIDHTGKLDLIAVTPSRGELRVFRNSGRAAFTERTAEANIPASLRGVTDIRAADWDGDDLVDIIVSRRDGPAAVLRNRFMGQVEPLEVPADWPSGSRLLINDLNNDLRVDAVVLNDSVQALLGAQHTQQRIGVADGHANGAFFADYDNDGWLDLVTLGDRVQAWRNVGMGGFIETSGPTGLAALPLHDLHDGLALDVDRDGDSDLIVAGEAGLRMLRNEQDSANRQLTVRLHGSRSNVSGIGALIEVRSGRFRTARFVDAWPIEIGIGARDELDAVTVVWSDQIVQAETNVSVETGTGITLREPLVSAASCPFIYAWNGESFRFVSDFLGTSPLGLRLTDDLFIPADVDEYLWLGDDTTMPPRGEFYELRITEELREVLYLDEVQFVAVDHPADHEVHSTDRLRPPPFAPGAIIELGARVPLRRATSDRAGDVTTTLQHIDGDRASPQRRRPQLRGLAHPTAITLDFGPLPADRPLTLALTGWLMWGGATSNVSASHDPSLPMPFPTLEVEDEAGAWHAMDVMVGAPAGRTKTIVVDLDGHLPRGARRLRLNGAMEIHWDRIALFSRMNERPVMRHFDADEADLHPRGISQMPTPAFGDPLTPNYDRLSNHVPWTRVPTGWFTRFGDVRPLLSTRDDAMVLMACGDELTIRVRAERLPPLRDGWRRDFFMFSVGWDKDADYHVKHGWTAGPIPWHGMDDQRYGDQPRPSSLNDAWIERYNTRWVGPEYVVPPSNRR